MAGYLFCAVKYLYTRINSTLTSLCHTCFWMPSPFLYNNNGPTYACNKRESPSSFFFFVTFALVIWEAWACKIGDSRLIIPFFRNLFLCGQLSYAASCLVWLPCMVDCLKEKSSSWSLDLAFHVLMLAIFLSFWWRIRRAGLRLIFQLPGGDINAFEDLKSRFLPSQSSIFGGKFNCIRQTNQVLQALLFTFVLGWAKRHW